ncbi:putative phosphatidylglycerol/phosphatidylinositol transfer protein DDB_G0278295 [Dysidea avara]|uniref:putative phosphatidylglycerol/phosphatidylinositol transfer protein DDB_G0278295 n=1 Tax=Dysidea avara TaxID=196820 RepID=UPI003333FE49
MEKVILLLVLLFGVVCGHPLLKLTRPMAPCSQQACGGEVKDLVVNFDPDPPKTGQTLKITITGHLDKEITGGEIDVTAKLFGIPVLNTKYNVCDVVSGGCPFQGAFTGSATQDITSSAPKREYVIDIKGTDQSGGELLCVEAKCTFE